MERAMSRTAWHLSLVLWLTIGLIPAARADQHAGPATCERLPVLQAWLERHADQWDPILSREPGYERPTRFDVCHLDGARPFADNHLNRVFVRRLQTADDEVTLAHEYVHLAFQHYPSGHDEVYVENTARRLIATYP
jgi:uncharacterized protein YfaQ (DUF2300 family)